MNLALSRIGPLKLYVNSYFLEIKTARSSRKKIKGDQAFARETGKEEGRARALH